MTASLCVTVPRAAAPKDLEVRPKQVKAWIEALPLANALEASKQLRDHLRAVNAAKIETDERLQILQAYRPIAQTLFEELEAIYAKTVGPLSPRAREALAVTRELAALLADGHKIAIAEKTGKLIAFGAKKQLPMLLIRAMEYANVALRASYKSYTPAPEGLWRALHELYLYAEAEGLAAEPADPETKASVHELYVETLLVALTDPYRLSPGEIERIVAQVRAVKAAVPLSQSKPATQANAHFLVPCDTDKPPKPALSANDDRGGANWRLLDANGVVEKLRTRQKAFDSGNVSAAAAKAMGLDGTALLGRLIKLWGDPPKRVNRRDPMDTSVAICIGLKGVSHYVSLQHRDEPAEADLIRRGITIPLISVPRDEASREFPVNVWEVVNQSSGGLKVRRDGASQQPVGVGEVVGVKLVGRARWTIGVARWITVLESGGLEFGIQFLANGARSVSIQPTIAALSAQAKQALLLSEGEAAPEALLTTPNTFSDLREFEVDAEGEVSCVRATNLLEKTGRFELFEFSAS
jgi:hypothetical protein